MFTVASKDIDSYDDARIDLVELATKKRKTLVRGGTYAHYSPSGHIVYARGGSLYAVAFDEQGRPEIYVRSWPGPGPKIQISSEGGIDPVWSRDSHEVFYRSESKMMVVSVSTAPTFSAGKPHVLWSGDYTQGLSSSCGLKGVTVTSYDVSPDGQRFLMIKDTDHQTYATKIAVVVNWAQELTRVMRDAGGGK